MPDLLAKDRTEVRERQYPSVMGQALGAYGSAWVEQANIALDKSQNRTIEMLGRPNVRFAERVSLFDGTDMTLGISVPAAFITDLRPRGPLTGWIKGGMRVRETNRATENDRTAEKWNINGGVGTALWHVDTGLTVDHSHASTQARGTDYGSYLDWKAKYGVYELPEGVAIIQDAAHQLIRAATKVNVALAERKIQALLADDDKLEQVAPKKDEMPGDGTTAVEANKKAGDSDDSGDSGDDDGGDSGDSDNNGDDGDESSGDDDGGNDSNGDEPPDKTKIDDEDEDK